MSFLYLGKEFISKSNGSKDVNLAKEIQDAHKKIAGEPRSRGYISDILDEVKGKGFSKEQVHDALKKMQIRGDLVLYRQDNPNELKDEHEEAAISMAGNPRHLVYFDGYKADIKPIEGGEEKKDSPAKNKEESKQQAAKKPDKSGKPKVSQESSDIYSTEVDDYKGIDPIDHYKISKYHEKNDYPAGAEAHKQMAKEKTKNYSAEEHRDLVTKLLLSDLGSFSRYHEDAAFEAEMEEDPQEDDTSGEQKEEPKEKKQEPEDTKEKPKQEEGKTGKTPKKEEPKEKTPSSDKEEAPQEPQESESVKQARALDYKAKASKLKNAIDEHLSSGDLSPEEEAKLRHISDSLDSHTDFEGPPSESQLKELQELEKITGDHNKPPEGGGQEGKQAEDPKKPPKGVFQEDKPSKEQGAEQEESGGEQKGDGTDWEYWGRPGTPPPDKGWEKSPTGKWRRPRGAGSSGGGGGSKVSVPSKGPSLTGAFQQGRAAGAALASAASSGSGAGGIAETSVNYASQGAMSAGHHLLKKPAQKKAQQQQTKPTQGQSSLGKSMSLYLDLYKADSPTTVMPRTESQAKVEYESSYAKVTTGVTGGGPSLKEDDPKEGRQWKHSEEDSVEAEVDEMLEDREPDNDEEETSKSLSILKTLNTVVTQDVQKHLPTETEMKFLIEELGHSPEEVKKGQVFITGKNRHRFNEWAHNNLIKSIQSLSGRLV